MADDLSSLLDHEKAIKENMTPFGRKLGIVKEESYAMYRIKYVDGKNGDIPDSLTGRWTTLANCESDLKGYLKRLWDFSNEKAKQASKPLAYAKSKSESASTGS